MSADTTAVLDRLRQSTSLFPISLAMADYDRTRPLIDGRVKPEGIALQTNTSWIGDFCVRPVYEEYDAAEMSLSWYMMARVRGEPVAALPAFPLRMPVLAYVFVRDDSPLKHPKDLAGKRIGTILYRLTVNLWLRGIFKDHYGLSPDEVNWVVTEGADGARFQAPADIKVTQRMGTTPEDLLRAGEVDAIFAPEIPDGFVEGTSGLRRLFADPQHEMRSYVQRTGILPITHTIVMKKSLAEQEPRITKSLYRAFCEAQDVCDEHLNANPKHTSLPDGVFFLEEQRKIYGTKPYVQGLEPNRKVLETFVRYANEQGYIPRRPTLEELFVTSVLR
jgi:4,5-dihydroxyphthalate decarboxylase